EDPHPGRPCAQPAGSSLRGHAVARPRALRRARPSCGQGLPERAGRPPRLRRRNHMQVPQGSTLALAVLLPLIAWRVYSRFKRMVGRQRLTKYRLWIQLSLFPTLVVLVAIAASSNMKALAAFGLSLAGGAALGRYGLRKTTFE